MKRALGIAGMLAAALALSACGGSVSVVMSDAGGAGADDGSGSSSGGAGSSGGGGSSGGQAPGQCPSVIPSDGTPCSASGLVCEYGDANIPTCDQTANCGQGGLWAVQTAIRHSCGEFSPGCPPSYASVAQGSACSSSAVCDYSEGRCDCTTPGGPVCVTPGGTACLFWSCQAPQTPGCPTRRPRLGSSCSTPNLTCDYGACSVQGSIAEVCSNGMWVETSVPCPL